MTTRRVMLLAGRARAVAEHIAAARDLLSATPLSAADAQALADEVRALHRALLARGDDAAQAERERWRARVGTERLYTKRGE